MKSLLLLLLLLLLLSPRTVACSTGPVTSDLVAFRAPFSVGYFSDAWAQHCQYLTQWKPLRELAERYSRIFILTY